MKKIKWLEQLKRYAFFVLMLAAVGVMFLVNRDYGAKAVQTTLFSLKEMLMVIPPIFILLGLLDVWVPRETMIKLMGVGSGLKGVLIAILIGSAAAGPLYGAFPVALVLMKKGARFSNVLIFVGAWSTTKIPMLLFELSSMGPTFTLTRLALSLVGIFLIAFAVEKVMSHGEIDALYQKASQMNP